MLLVVSSASTLLLERHVGQEVRTYCAEVSAKYRHGALSNLEDAIYNPLKHNHLHGWLRPCSTAVANLQPNDAVHTCISQHKSNSVAAWPEALCLLAVALDRWEAMKMAWKANKADWGFDVEAAAQNGHLGSALEGPAVALLHSDAERREFISAGAAAGLAASSHSFPDHLTATSQTPHTVHVWSTQTVAHSKRGLHCVVTNQ